MFVLGMIFALSILPLLDSITAFLITALETTKSYLSVCIARNNLRIEEQSTDNQTFAIGFQAPEEEEYDL